MDPPVSAPPSPYEELLSREAAFASVVPASEAPRLLAKQRIGSIPSRSAQANAAPIEDRLMRKSREAKIRFATRKKEIETEQLKELKATPTIDPNSRKIAEQNFLHKFFPEKLRVVLKDQPSDFDMPLASFASPKPQTPSFLSSLHRAEAQTERQESAEKEQRETFVMVPRCHVSLPEGTSTKVYLPVRLGPADRYDLVPADPSHLHPDSPSPQPPLHPLDMTPEQRSQHFLQLKDKKLKEEIERIRAEELKECTFKPEITRRATKEPEPSVGDLSGGPSVAMSDRSHCSQSSYTDRYQKRQELIRLTAPKPLLPKGPSDGFKQDEKMRVPPPNPMTEAALPRAQPAPPMEVFVSPFYTPLSPAAQTVGFRAGCDFLALQDKLKSIGKHS